MKRKDPLGDMELYIDPTPLTKEEKIALSNFIKKLKAKGKKIQFKQRRLGVKRAKEHSQKSEDFLDIIVAESRKGEPKRGWDEVKKSLKKKL